MDMYASPLIDAGTLCTICLAVLMLAINRSKVVQFRNRIAPNRLPAFRPISRTNLTVFILHRHRVMSVPPPHERTRNPTHGELERLHKTQRLVDRSSDGQIVHRDLSQHPLGIDQIARAQRDPLVLDQTPVLARDAHVAVGQQRDAQIGPEAACGAGLLRPGVVGVLRVGRDACVFVARRVSGDFAVVARERKKERGCAWRKKTYRARWC
jgi:hypothetical protein